MHILIKTISGASCKISNVESVQDVQSEIESQMGVPCAEQKLLFNGARLSEGLLSEYGIDSSTTISLIIALEGGAKGKKKKKDLKKNKKKHKKKKVNLAILKYYKVSEDDKVIRLKQMCKVCPPGTFLANHFDRLNCGRCRTLFKKNVIDVKPKDAPKKVTEKPKVETKTEKGGKGKKK